MRVKRRFDTYPLRMFVFPWSGQLLTTIAGNAELFSESAIELLADRHLELAALAMDHADVPLESLRSMTLAASRPEGTDA
jgi:hypothetical protein